MFSSFFDRWIAGWSEKTNEVHRTQGKNGSRSLERLVAVAPGAIGSAAPDFFAAAVNPYHALIITRSK
jgi:hypothetical protein